MDATWKLPENGGFVEGNVAQNHPVVEMHSYIELVFKYVYSPVLFSGYFGQSENTRIKYES